MFYIKVLVPARFLMKVFYCVFLHATLNVRVSQRRKKLILHKIINIYPHIIFMNKGISIVQKLHT